MTTSKAYWTTVIGSMVGSIVGGFVLGWLANATSSGGLEAILYIVLLTLGGVWGGAVGGAWVVLALKHAPRIAHTVTWFAGVLLLAIVPLSLLVGRIIRLLPFDLLPASTIAIQGVLVALGIGAIAAGVHHLSTR